VIVQLPPDLEHAVVHIRIVVPILRQSIVDHHTMQVEAVLASLSVGLRQN
jgi:hypothetical protein